MLVYLLMAFVCGTAVGFSLALWAEEQDNNPK